MTTDTSTAPERTHITWPSGYTSTGLAFSLIGKARTEYVRRDLFDAMQARVEYLESIGKIDRDMNYKTSNDVVHYKARAEKAEGNEGELRRQLGNMTAVAQDRHAERDLLRAENERLREALLSCEDALDLHGKMYPHMVKGYTLDALNDARAALERKEEGT